jgi:hypothetical protein
VAALNFAREHAPKVEARTKKRTIRLTQRAKVGDRIQLYTGQRTPDCRKLSAADPVCTRVTKVEIHDAAFYFDGHRQDAETADSYAREDGFPGGFSEMREWFLDRYGTLPLCGYEHRWEWPESE